jgi:hypothetical protein
MEMSGRYGGASVVLVELAVRTPGKERGQSEAGDDVPVTAVGLGDDPLKFLKPHRFLLRCVAGRGDPHRRLSARAVLNLVVP